jgi:hypothetical protein
MRQAYLDWQIETSAKSHFVIPSEGKDLVFSHSYEFFGRSAPSECQVRGLSQESKIGISNPGEAFPLAVVAGKREVREIP